MKQSMFKTITFFYPSHVLGGAELLFLRLARELSEIHLSKVKIQYVDYEDGYVANEISKSGDNINLIPFTGNKPLYFSKRNLLITPLSSIFDICRHFFGGTKILFWSIHPIGLKAMIDIYSKNLTGSNYNIYGEDLSNLISLGGVHFMDGPNLDIQKNLYEFEISNRKFLPIFCRTPLIKKDYGSNSSPKKNISLGWLGRLSAEKVTALANIIDHCNNYLTSNTDESIDFHIIGEGDKMSFIRSKETVSNLNLRFLGTLSGDDLDKYLIEKVDLVFAMGTSALETSLLNIPTILVDFSYIDIPLTNRFRFVHESVEFSVADEYHDENIYPHDFSSLMNKIANGNIENDAIQGLHYVKNNHSKESVIESIKSITERISLNLNTVRRSKFGYSLIRIMVRSLFYNTKRWLKI